jgi:hypothetical protein
VAPNTGRQGESGLQVSVTGVGTHFTAGTPVVSLGAGVNVTAVQVASDTLLTATVDISPSAPLQANTVSVTTAGEVAVLPTGFTVFVNVPAIVGSGGTLARGATADLQVSGAFTHFVQGQTTASLGTDVVVNSVTVSSPTSATLNVTVAPAAAAGPRNLVVTTGQEVVGSAGYLTIQAVFAPTANAGGPYIFDPGTVTLDGRASIDVQGLPLTFQWALPSVPAGSLARFVNPTADQPSLVVDRAASYLVTLVVSNGTVSSPPASTVVVVRNVAPVANAGPNQVASAGATVHLSGTGSTDANGDALTYAWLLTTAPAGSAAALSDTQSATPTFVADRVGTFTAQLTVTDTGGLTGTSTVVVSTGAVPPAADAGPDQAVNPGPVTLDGSRSSDPGGLPLAYQWSFVSRPAQSAATLDDPAAVRPTFVADRSGDYTIRLVVDNGYFASAPATTRVTTRNVAPVANAGASRTVTLGAVVTLDGSGSTDANGDPLTYTWSAVSVPAGSAATLTAPDTFNPAFTPDLPGNYVFQLVVSDGQVSSAPATVTISTNALPPVASAGPNQAVGMGVVVHLDGSGSTSPNGPLVYTWSMLSVPAGSLAVLSDAHVVSPTFLADRPGTYVVQLIVADPFGVSAPATATITTSVVPPVANAGSSRTAALGDTVTLDGSASTSAVGLPLSYQWSVTSRPQGSAAALSSTTAVTPTFTVDRAGDYVFQLIVNDGLSASVPATVTISTVAVPPIAKPGANQMVTTGDLVHLDGSASVAGNGYALTYSWTLLTAPAGSTAVLANPTSATPSFVADKEGDYVVQLVVADVVYASAPATVKISTTNLAPVANPGPAQTVTLGATVVLDGSSSISYSGYPLTHAWTFTSIPAGSVATLGNATSASASFVADVVGTYVVQLIVNDHVQNSPPATVAITVNGAPVLSLSTLDDFGSVYVGSTRSQTLSVSNNGSASLLVTGLNVAGTNAADFDVTPAVQLPVTVPPGASTTATVTFRPAAAGGRSASLTVLSNDPAPAPTVGLAGTGVEAPVIVSVPTIGLGDVQVGYNSASGAFTLTNTSPATVTVNYPQLSNGTDFVFTYGTNGDFCGYTRTTLSPGQGCSVYVYAHPQAAGQAAGTITVVSSAANSPHVVTVTANGYTVTDQATAGALAFPDTQVGYNSAAQTVITITNPNARGIVAVGYPQMTNGADFVFTYGTNSDFCGYTRTNLNPGESCNVYVYARPQAAGPRATTLTVTTNATTSPHVVNLSATGYTVVDQATPGALVLPDTQVGYSSPAQTVLTITNPNARGVVAVAYPQLSNGADFVFTYGTNNDFCGYTRTTLNPGESCNIYVYARPQAVGARSTTLTVTTNATTSPHSVNLGAIGFTVVDQAAPGTPTFPDTQVGYSSPAQTVLTITNPNVRGVVAVSYPQLSNPTDFVFTYGANSDFCGYTRTTLNPGESCNVYVYAHPQAAGPRSATLTVTTNATTSPHAVSLAVSGSSPDEELR